MKTAIDRSYLTDYLLEILEPDENDDRVWYVGDCEKPEEGGWQGEVGQSDWIPYMVLTPQPSSNPTGDIARPDSDVWFSYSVTIITRTRRMAEKLSYTVQERLVRTQRKKTSDGRTIAQAQMQTHGGSVKLGIEPPLYALTDQFRVYTTP